MRSSSWLLFENSPTSVRNDVSVEILKSAWPSRDTFRLSEDYTKRSLPANNSHDSIDYFEYTGKPIELRGTETRPYRLLRLSNNMEVMLIQDSDKNKASAAMSVGVGSAWNPVDLPGIAHFCEHMLFLGTKKYPNAGEFKYFLSSSGGCSNAFTSADETCYFYNVSNSAFHESLDRFSQFFTSSTFEPKYADREVKQIDSEHKKNIENDSWRNFRLRQVLADPKHATSKFYTGNYETLAVKAKEMGVSLNDKLLEFYNRYYSADIMKLAVVGSHSLDTLAEWAVSMFTPVVSKGQTVDDLPGIPYGPEQLGRIAHFKTVRKLYSLKICFALPGIKHLFKTKPDSYISGLLRNFSRGSLFTYLNENDWVETMNGGLVPSTKGSDFYHINVALTKSGFDNYQNVLWAVFSYLNMLRQTTPSEAFFREIQQNSSDEFQFDPCSYDLTLTQDIASNMSNPYYPSHMLISGPELLHDFSPSDIEMILRYLRAENCFVMLGSDESLVEYTQTEAYYGIEYHVEPFDRDFLDKLESIEPYSEFKMPLKNRFISYDLKPLTGIAPSESPDLQPTLLLRNDLGEVWHRKDDRFFLPNGVLVIKFISSLFSDSAKNCVSYGIFLSILNKLIKLETSDATIAGLQPGIIQSTDGFYIKINGFTPKMMVLMELLIDLVKSFDPTESYFQTAKESDLRSLRNSIHNEPDSQGFGWIQYLTNSRKWGYDEKIEALEQLDRKDLVKYVESFRQSVYTKVVALGDFEESIPLQAYNFVQDKFRPQPPQTSRDLIDRKYPNRFVFQNPCTVNIQCRSTSKENLNSALIFNIYTGIITDAHSNICLEILSKMVCNSVYKQLRTDETLGYIVYCSHIKSETGYSGLRIYIKSECDPLYVQLRVYSFFKSFRQPFLEKLPECDLQRIVDAAITKRQKPDYDIYMESGRYLDWIDNSMYKFFSDKDEIQVLLSFTKEKLLKFWDERLSPLENDMNPIISIIVYSSKIWMPSIRERQMYPMTVCALLGCLEQARVTGVKPSVLSEIVTDIHSRHSATNNGTMDDVVREFKAALAKLFPFVDTMNGVVRKFKAALAKRFPSVDIDLLDKAFASSDSYPRMALKMSIDNYVDPIPEDQIQLKGVDDKELMYQTPHGHCVLENFTEYRNTLTVAGPPVPYHDLIPTYPDL